MENLTCWICSLSLMLFAAASSCAGDRADAWRPRWHLVIDGNGNPGDPNGAFWKDGRYHLMYLVQRGDDKCWAHVSSSDLLDWRQHPDALKPGPMDKGCWSGGAFVDEDGSVYLSYWMVFDGVGLAKNADPRCERWEKLAENPVVRSTRPGVTDVVNPVTGAKESYGSADPSNIWKKDGRYYMLTGNLQVLLTAERKTGDAAYLFRSDDLKTWTYLHPFFDRRPGSSRANGWTDDDEDCMCPVFLPLPLSPQGGAPGERHILLQISHCRGCRYYVGRYDVKADRFLPDRHGRMTWEDRSYFAPEAMIDGQGRLLMWTWMLDNPSNDLVRAGWSGVLSLPRVLWDRGDGSLGIAPTPELERLRCDGRSDGPFLLAAGDSRALTGFPGDSFDLELEMDGDSARSFALELRASSDGTERTVVRYDAAGKRLVFDGTRSGFLDIPSEGSREFGWAAHVPVEKAPFELAPGELLRLRVLVDGPMVEVFANDRQAVSRRVYPKTDSTEVRLVAKDGPVAVKSLRTWKMSAQR